MGTKTSQQHCCELAIFVGVADGHGYKIVSLAQRKKATSVLIPVLF